MNRTVRRPSPAAPCLILLLCVGLAQGAAAQTAAGSTGLAVRGEPSAGPVEHGRDHRIPDLGALESNEPNTSSFDSIRKTTGASSG